MVEAKRAAVEAQEDEMRAFDSKRAQAPLKGGGGFGAIAANAIEKCASCTKTVYASERVGAAGKVYHTTCFRCAHCNEILEPTNFANLNQKNYCPSDFQTLVNKNGLNF